MGSMLRRHAKIVILGLGNLLHADEGIGVYVAEKLYRAYDFPDHVDIVDGGIRGAALLPCIEKADRLLLVDAVDFGLGPGEVVRCRNGHVPAYLAPQTLNAHRSSMSEVLGLACLRNMLPGEIVLIGMQPADLTYGAPLSPAGCARTALLADLCLDVLRTWGVLPVPAVAEKHLHHPWLPDEPIMPSTSFPGRISTVHFAASSLLRA